MEYQSQDYDEGSQDVLEHEESQQPREEARGVDCGVLIELIQNSPFLYDLSHKSYKNTKLKAQVWQQISDVLKCSVEDCVKTWKNLRDRFVKEKKKLSSGSAAPESNWAYFDAMVFYGNYSKPRKTYTTTKKTEPKDTPQSAPSSRASSSVSVWSNITMDTITSPESHSILEDEINIEGDEEPIPSTSRATPEQTTPKRQSALKQVARETPSTSATGQRKRKRATDDTQKSQMGDLVEVANTIATQFMQRPKNANSALAEYIYQELEKLPEAQAKAMRKKLLLALMEDE